MPTPNYNDDPSFLFTLRVPTSKGMVVIHAYENTQRRSNHGHTYIDTVVRLNGETVLSLIAMKPGDTDRDYFSW